MTGDVLEKQGSTRVEAFTFGEPTPVLDARGIYDYLDCWTNGRWYEPPISLEGLSKTTRSNVYLKSGLKLKTNLLARTFRPHRLLPREVFEQFATDWVHFGMAYLERRSSMLRTTLSLGAPLAKYMRRGIEDGQFYQVKSWRDEHEFRRGTVFQLREADVDQEIYGLPEWLAAIQSALLNESATLFRRKYYNNGSHAGFILYLSDPNVDTDDVDAIREALKGARGPGNFRNLFVHSPNGKKDGMQLIPVSEVAAKDEFTGIKNVTRDDVLASLRIPPQLLGLVPTNAGGFGSVREAASVYVYNEITPIQARLLRVNDWVGDEVIQFEPFDPAAMGAS